MKYEKRHIKMIDPTRIKKGDYVRSRYLKKWMKVDSLKKINGEIFIVGTELITDELMVFSIIETTPSWNPKKLQFGN